MLTLHRCVFNQKFNYVQIFKNYFKRFSYEKIGKTEVFKSSPFLFKYRNSAWIQQKNTRLRAKFE